jgi:hypothetical protein
VDSLYLKLKTVLEELALTLIWNFSLNYDCEKMKVQLNIHLLFTGLLKSDSDT